MYTLIEIFDSKQYENIITPVTLSEISKVIYIGTENIMTHEKKQCISKFFEQRNVSFQIEFFTVERDNSEKTMKLLETIINTNSNCIFDVTGGEDVILTIVGACAAIHSLPVIRTNPQGGKLSIVRGEVQNIRISPAYLSINDLICLQGGKLIRSTDIKSFSNEECSDIKTLFLINASDCEAYSLFINFISEYVSDDLSEIFIPEEKLRMLSDLKYKSAKRIISMLTEGSLIIQASKENHYAYKIKNKLIALCLKKSGNILEYYTAMATTHLPDTFREIKLGATVEWNNTPHFYDTQNEIDVLTVSHNFPVFISCKNGSVKKDALYELDAVSRALGGVYSKKILVCTFISANKSSRDRFIKRAKDMNIHIIYDVHKKDFEQFLNYLKI